MSPRRTPSICDVEALAEVFALRDLLRQHLQRDLAIETRIASAVHLSHPARAEAGDDLVPDGVACRHPSLMCS